MILLKVFKLITTRGLTLNDAFEYKGIQKEKFSQESLDFLEATNLWFCGEIDQSLTLVEKLFLHV